VGLVEFITVFVDSVSDIAHTFNFCVTISVGTHTSKGHMNPIIAFDAFVGSNITFLCGVVDIIAQLLVCVVASHLLAFVISSTSLKLTGIENFSQVCFAHLPAPGGIDVLFIACKYVEITLRLVMPVKSQVMASF